MLYNLKSPVNAWQYTGQNLSVIRNQFSAVCLHKGLDPKTLVMDETTKGSFKIYFLETILEVKIGEFLALMPYNKIKVYTRDDFETRFTVKID